MQPAGPFPHARDRATTTPCQPDLRESLVSVSGFTVSRGMNTENSQPRILPKLSPNEEAYGLNPPWPHDFRAAASGIGTGRGHDFQPVSIRQPVVSHAARLTRRRRFPRPGRTERAPPADANTASIIRPAA